MSGAPVGLVVWLSVQVTLVPLGPRLAPGICTGGMRGLPSRQAGTQGGPSLPVGHRRGPARWHLGSSAARGKSAPSWCRHCRAGRPGPSDLTSPAEKGPVTKAVCSSRQSSASGASGGWGLGWTTLSRRPSPCPHFFPGSARPCCRHPAPP